MHVNREKLHTRNVHCEGFQRSDGLWDIEATLTDTKTRPFHNHERGEVTPGEPIHEISLRVALDLDMKIHEIEVRMPHTPFGLCKSAGDAMSSLIGESIGAGWRRKAKELIGPTESCTHVMELLGPVSTTAYQTMHFAIEERENKKSDRGAPPILDQCKSLARDSAIVKVMWPKFYKSD